MNRMNRLYTYVNTYNTLELLKIYIDKITNGKSKHLKFIDEFDVLSMDLLFTSIKYKNIKCINYDKLDKKELNYYIKRSKGITYFSKQNNTIKDKESLIRYIVNKLNIGDYYYTLDGIIRIGNVIVDKEWLLEFSEFLINSYYLEDMIDNNNKKFVYTINEKKTYYEYTVEKTNKKEITYHEKLYLYDIFKDNNKYDFEELKILNSKLQKEGYILSVNKNKNSNYPISNRKEYVLARKVNDMYELFRSVAHAYDNRYSLWKCRELFTINDKKYVALVYVFSLYYLEYLYDYSLVSKNLDYDSINLYKIKPTIIDYRSKDYKKTLIQLNKKKKEIVKQNRVIDLYLMNDFRKIEVLKKKGYKLSHEANKLCKLVVHKNMLQSNLDILSKLDEKSNRVLFDYITKGIFASSYVYKNNILEITIFDKNKIIFGIEININVFLELLLDKDNLNNRVRIYEKG